MAELLEQLALKPARYHMGGGVYRDLTAEQIQEYVQGTEGMIAAGYEPPLIAEHAPPGSDEGAPRPLTGRDDKANAVKHGAGWLKNVKGSDGSATFRLQVTDPKIAESLKNGSIKFTSPELRESWTDGAGNVHRKIISHVALTHKPRNPNQGPFVPVDGVGQFSLEDAVQMSAEDEETDKLPAELDKTKADDETEDEAGTGNPDLPPEEEEGTDAKRAERIEAIIGHLGKRGISMPEDTCQAEEAVLLDRLLTALMTANAADDKAAADAAAEEPEEEMPEVAEERPAAVQQYSLADADAGKIENKLLSRIIKQEHAGLVSKLEGMVRSAKISAATRDQLLGIGGAMQFSADGEFQPALSLPQIVDVLDASLPDGMALEISQLSIEEHPNQDFLTGNPDGLVPPEKVDEVAMQDMKSRPGMYKVSA